MFVVIFEVEPRTGKAEDYLQLAGRLRSELDKIDGFVEVERFASRLRQGRLLSLSTWCDEKALIRWRTMDRHHAAQETGRTADSGIWDDKSFRTNLRRTAFPGRPDGLGRLSYQSLGRRG